MEHYHSVDEAIKSLTPDEPLHIFRPDAIRKAATFFLNNFRGNVMYAVKTNPEALILQHLHDLGIRRFDVASLNEVKTVRGLFADAELFFMHTVKSRNTIRAAYFDYGVRNFALDSEEELEKILQETGHAKDLKLHVRLAIPNTYAELNLADKFGINLSDAPALLKKTREHTESLGICFHVGSQCMHPDAYRIAIHMAMQVLTEADVPIETFDVGGGFPSVYPGMIPPPMHLYFEAIHEEFAKLPNAENCTLMCEPGRALVAESGSVVVKVELRKREHLYINDGTYGSLFDAGQPHFIFPVKMIRPAQAELVHQNMLPFSFFGPTCDTLDFMKGPFYLPEDCREGDYIEVGQLGAYGRTLSTGFNGFHPVEQIVVVDDEPLMSMYSDLQRNNYLEIAA